MGFFTKDQIVSGPDCDRCGLFRGCKSPRMPYSGEGKRKALIIGEAPGAVEDQKGIQFVGDSGTLLREELKHLGLDLDRDFWKTNAIACRPKDNRTPAKSEILSCKGAIENVIKRTHPAHIFLLGSSATTSLLSVRDDNPSSGRWRGRHLPDYDITGAWIHFLYHPSYVLRAKGEGAELAIFREDLLESVSRLDETLPERYRPEKQVKTLYQADDVIQVLKSTLEKCPSQISFDYETTGLKPYKEGHRIDTIAYFDGEYSYSFPFLRPGHFDSNQIGGIKRLWRRVLLHPSIGLITHNQKFEDVWSRQIVGVTPNNFQWDTMTNQHLLDERLGTKGLKWLGWVRWGLPDWDGEMEPYLKAVGSNDFNKVHLAPLDQLLLYNGIDAAVTYQLWKEQVDEVKEQKQEYMVSFYQESLETLADIQEQGIPVLHEYYQNEDNSLEKQIDEQLEKLHMYPPVQKYREIKLTWPDFGKKDQVLYILKNILGHKIEKTTSSGDDALDKEVLGVIGTPFCEDILHLRRLQKVKSTYVGQFLREITNGKMHPFFDLHTAKTGRSSSRQPNFQNVPVRDEEAKKSSRSGIVPLPGHKIIEVDYSALEVRIIAAQTQDKNLCAYIYDPTTDMHRDQAEDIFLLCRDEITKNLRFYAKNGFVFPEFYGSYYRSCARELQKETWGLKTKSGVFIYEHMRKQGIRSYEDFEAHLREVENRFWARFPEVREWQERMFSFHAKHGYIENPFGFRMRGAMSRNQIANGPIQGAAFQCLLWSLNEINRIRKEEKWKSVIIGQIHDSIVSSVHSEEEKHIVLTIDRVMTKDILKVFDWICVPFEIEVEATEIDQAWYYKKPVNLSYYNKEEEVA